MSRLSILKWGLSSADNPYVADSDRQGRRAPEGGLLASARVLIFCALLAGGVSALLLTRPLASASPVRHLLAPPAAAALLVALFIGVNLAPLSVRFRGRFTFIVLNEIPLLLGLVIVAPRVLVISRVIGDAVVLGLTRRQALYKVTYNVVAGAMGAALAALVYRPIVLSHAVVGPYGWAAGCAALVTAIVFSNLSMAIVRRIFGQPREPDYASRATASALVTVASVALAFVVLDASVLDVWAIAPLILVAALVVFAYRQYILLDDRFGALEQLYEFSRSVGVMSLESTGTGWAILEQVLAVMRTRRAELVTSDGEHIHRLALHSQSGRSSATLPMTENSLVARIMSRGEAELVAGRTGPRGPELIADPLFGEFENAVAVPILSRGKPAGVLVALDRVAGMEALADDDLRLFEALAAHAGTTLERARLIEELRLEAESKSHQATHDALTDLPNRTLFLEYAAASLAETGRAAIALLDLDRFKEVNDTLGHGMGDRLLCEVAERLVRVVGDRASVARLGGDEFALVIPGVIGPEEAIGIVKDIEAAISRPVYLDGVTLAVTASAGITLGPEHGDNVAVLLQRADIAMYHAKERRSGIELYSASHDGSRQRKLLLGGKLAEALGAGSQLSLMYQPIAEFSTGAIVRVEALCRWYHPDHGQVPADEFIAIAEQMGLIRQITEFVLREGLDQLAEVRAAGFDIGLAVNLSGQDLNDHTLVPRIAALLAENELPPESLSLEVTETEVMEDITHAKEMLAELGKLGVRIAVDDYGTGYSSLAYLHSLPLNELKLDRSFVSNIAANQSNWIIVRSSIAMAHSLGLSVVAEGAEDDLTCSMLSHAGCDEMQGYYLSPPLVAEDLIEWLRSRPRLRFPELPAAHPLRVISGRLQDLA